MTLYPHNAEAVALGVTKTGQGMVISTTPAGISCDPDCDDDYPAGTIVTLTAIPGAGYYFSGWTSGCVSEALSCKVTLNAATNVHATFAAGTPLSVTWSRMLGDGATGNQYLYAIQQTTDGGYIGAGRAYNQVSNSDELYVVKLLQNGTVAWERTYRLSANMNKASSIQQTADGGYIVAGTAGDMYFSDAWILKLYPNGNVHWEYTFDTSANDDALSIQQTSDGGYIFAGICDTGSGAMPPDDFCITKIDSSGTLVWQKTYDGSDTDIPLSISQTRDGGFIVAGYTYSFNDPDYDTDALIMKLDGNGERLWQRVYGMGNGFYDEAHSVYQTSDDGYVVAGNGFDDFWAMKLDSSGSILWQMTFDRGEFADEANAIRQTYDGGIIVAGNSDGDIWIMKLNNADGQYLWQKTYDLSSNDNAYAIQQTADGGFIVAGGYWQDTPYYSNHIQVLKLDENGDIAGECPINYVLPTYVPGANPEGSVWDPGIDALNQTPVVVPNTETMTPADFPENEVCTAPPAIYWMSPVDGNWDGESGFNWSTGTEPAVSDDVQIIVPCTGSCTSGYTVLLATDTEINSLTIGDGGMPPGQILNVDGYTLTLNHASIINQNGQITANNFTLYGSTTLTVNGILYLFGNNTINPYVSLGWGDLVVNYGNNLLNGILTTQSTSRLAVIAVTGGTDAQLAIANGFTNNGLIELNYNITGPTASLLINSGTLMNAASGVIQGRGTLDVSAASFSNAGTINPGASPGILNITGNLSQQASGVLNIEIDGNNVGSEYDQLNVSGMATLAGTLNVSLEGGFDPPAGSSFTIMTYGSRSGTFNTENLPVLSGKTWSVSYGTGALTLTVLSTPSTYTLNITKLGTGSGTVRSSEVQIPSINCCSGACEPVCSSFYDPNTQVILNAIPDADSTFIGWSGACTGASSCYVSMDNDKDVTAVFNLRQYTVSTQTNQGGAIFPTSTTVFHGDSAEFNISVNTGYQIESITGCSGSLDGYTYYTGPITANCTVTVIFVSDTHTVSSEVIPQAGGSINPASATVNHNATRQFTVSAAPGYHIVSVTGCGGALSGNTYTTGQITADCTVSAAFGINTYTVISSSGSGGSISPLGATTVNHGGTPAFTVTPNPGYHIAGVNGTCGGSLNGNTYTSNSVTGNCTVQASFAINTYTVNASAGAGGGISPSGTITVNHGGTPAFTVTPNPGYHIMGVNGTCGGSLNGNTYTTNPVTGNCTVHASFAINEYTVSTRAGQGGGIAPASAKVTHGNTAQFTITPDTGYHISSVSGCGGTLSQSSLKAAAKKKKGKAKALASTTYTTGQITENCTVTATFEIDTYTVTSSSGPGGSISPSGTTTVNHGGTPAFTVTANSGYHIMGVNGTCGGSLNGNTYTTNPVTGNCTVHAEFEINEYTVTALAGQGGGIDPAGAKVTHGNTVQFTITPDTGYHIVSVSGCGGTLSESSLKSAAKKKKGKAKALASTTYTIGQIRENCTVTASFEINAYTVTADAGPGGSISPSGTTTVNHGETPAFTVTPNPGYHIMGVNGTCGGELNGNTYTVNSVTGNCTVHAIFELNEYTVSASAGQGGGIAPASAQVTHGNTVQFTITPDTGYHLLYAGGCGGTVSQSSLKAAAKKKKKGKASALAVTTYTTGPITDACTVTATFEINAYTVTADAGPGGSISPLGTTTVNHGGTPVFTVTPNPGYHMTGVDGTCGGSLNGNTYTANPVTGNCSVHAEFEINEYTVSTSAEQGGRIDPASAKVTHGNTEQFTITPDTGYHIASVSGCGGTLNGFVYTTGEITANCTVTAVFNIATYTVSILKSGSGSGSIIAQGLICEGDSCSGEYAHGARIIFNVQPDPGFRVADVRIDGVSIGAMNTFTFKKMKGNHSIEILFAPL